MRPSVAGIIGVLALLTPHGAAGQEPVAARPPAPARDSMPAIPVSARPPAGMCRIWLDNVPVAQQSAPTDCASAVRNRPAKGRVVFGDDFVTKKAGNGPPSLPFVKGFAAPKPTAKVKVRKDTLLPR